MLERLLRASESFGVVKETHEEMGAEHDAVDLERDLVGIDIGAEVAFLDRDARGLGQLVDPVFLRADQRVVWRARPIVELCGRPDEETATRAGSPTEPILEQRTQARLATRLAQGGDHHFLHELTRCFLDDCDLERFLRSEVSEQARLGKPGLLGQPTDREARHARDGRQLEGLLQNRLPGFLALAHNNRIERSCYLSRRDRRTREVGYLGFGCCRTAEPGRDVARTMRVMGGSAADAIRSVAIVASRAASNARWRPVPALVLIACGSGGCGRIFFEPHRSDGDASTDDVAVADAAGTCDSQAPFGAPRLISELSDLGALDGTLRLMPDELTGYMWSYTQRADGDLYYVTRSALDLPFTMTRVTSVSTASQELDPTFTSDGSMVVFRRSGPGDDLYVAPISAPGVLGTVTPINAVNGASTEAQPFMPLGRNELYFQSTRTMAGDIYISTWSGGTTFSTPTLVAGLATPSVEGDPVVTGDGLTIYYRSDAPAAIARFNIYVATRASTTDPFGAPQLVPNVNTPADDGPSWISPNGCRLYISSDLGGTNDIYVSTRGL
jgi:hypothetical protein